MSESPTDGVFRLRHSYINFDITLWIRHIGVSPIIAILHPKTKIHRASTQDRLHLFPRKQISKQAKDKRHIVCDEQEKNVGDEMEGGWGGEIGEFLA